MRMRNRSLGLFATIGLVTAMFLGTAPAAHADDEAPSIVSANATSFTVGSNTDTFTVQATGNPTPNILESGALPSGVSFLDNGDGTATLAGTAALGTAGSYPLTITATNNVAPDATQDFTLTVNPLQTTFVSANTATFTVRTPGSFTVQVTADPTPGISESGALPSGVTFTDNHDGTATLAGTPDLGTAGAYPLTFTATNGVAPDATQDFTLTVNPLQPSIVSVSAVTFAEGITRDFTVRTTGDPTPSISESGALPSGVTFTDNHDGTATLAGTPDPGTADIYGLTITATNGVAPDANQDFALTVVDTPVAPSITSASVVTFVEGNDRQFIVQATGAPTPSVSESGALPSGLSFTDNGDGTAMLEGTAGAGTTGTYPLTITAANSVAPDATQDLILTIIPPLPMTVVGGECSGIRFLGTITPPLAADGSAKPAVVSLKTTKLGTVVWGPGFGSSETETGAASCAVGQSVFNDATVAAKLSGVASCDSLNPDPSLYPLNGKLQLRFATGALSTQAYVRVAGYDPVPGPDVVALTGMEIKGSMPGATVSGEMFLDPVIRAAANGENGGPELKGQYYFDNSQIVAACGNPGSNPIGLVFGGDGVSLLGSSASGLLWTFAP